MHDCHHPMQRIVNVEVAQKKRLKQNRREWMLHRKDHILALRQYMVSAYVTVYGLFSVTTAFPTPPERPFPFAGANRPANPAAAIVSATHARTIFVGAPRIAKQVCVTLEVKPDFAVEGT